MNLWLVFLTGITTGGLSCLAVQGGLLASVITQQKTQEQQKTTAAWQPVLFFLLAKLLSHTILGALLGWLGTFFVPHPSVQLFFQALTGTFILVTALNLLDVHPFFRRFVLQPPAFLRRWIRARSGQSSLFAPAVLGTATIFIPCGVTQAMEVLAISSGSPVQGALIMSTFVLGTSPLFALVGIVTARLADAWQQRLLRYAAIGLIALSFYTLNGVLVVLNSPFTAQKVTEPVRYFFSAERFSTSSTTPVVAGVQQVTLSAHNYGYAPERFVVKAGVPVALTLVTNETYSCAVAFRFPDFGIKTFLEPTGSQTFTFTPTKPGRYTYTCSMGMYTGVMEVI